jgi:hypothetical protein
MALFVSRKCGMRLPEGNIRQTLAEKSLAFHAGLATGRTSLLRLITLYVPLIPRRRAKAPPPHLYIPDSHRTGNWIVAANVPDVEELRGLAEQMHRKLSHL